MTNKKIQPAIIGIFVVISIFLFMAAIVIFGGSSYFEKENIVIMYFDGSLQGLSVGAPVTYRGVTVGQVKEIKIHIQTNANSNQKLTIPVLVSLSAGKTLIVDNPENNNGDNVNIFLEAMCEDGLRAKLKVVSIVTGKRFIDLAFYENSTPVYRDTNREYFEIPTLPSEMHQITKMLENINLDELYQKVMNTFTSIEQLTGGLAKTLDNEKTQGLVDEFSTVATNLNQLLLQLETGIPPILQKVDNGMDQINTLVTDADGVVKTLKSQLPPIAESIDETLSGIDTTVRQANDLLTQAGTVLQPSSPLYHNLSTAIQQLEKMAGSIERLSDYIHRNPDTLIFGLQHTGKNTNE